MRVRVTMPTKDGKRLREKVIEGAEKIEDDEMGQQQWEVVRDGFMDLYLLDTCQLTVEHRLCSLTQANSE